MEQGQKAFVILWHEPAGYTALYDIQQVCVKEDRGEYVSVYYKDHEDKPFDVYYRDIWSTLERALIEVDQRTRRTFIKPR